MIKLSIIIPSYKGSETLKKNLPELAAYLQQQSCSYEVIIVDDGSPDDEQTKRVVESYGYNYLANDHNMGKGAAVRKGMLYAKGEYKLFTDADIPFSTQSIHDILYYLEDREFDIVIGDRTLEKSQYFEKISILRKLGSVIFTFFVTRFITGGLADTQCGLKGFKRKIADDLFSVNTINGFAADVEILYVALKRNYDIKRLPVQLRNNEESTVSLLKHAPRMVLDILSLKINHLLGRYKKEC